MALLDPITNAPKNQKIALGVMACVVVAALGYFLLLSPKQTDNPAMPFRAIVVKGGRLVDEVTLDKPDGDFDKLMFSEQSLSSAPLTPEEAAIFDQTTR